MASQGEECKSTITAPSDRNGPVTPGHGFLISGVIIPHQLKDEEIIFDPINNKTGLLNRVETIVYSITDISGTKYYKKPVSMIRVFEDGSEYDSILEFYHVYYPPFWRKAPMGL